MTAARPLAPGRVVLLEQVIGSYCRDQFFLSLHFSEFSELGWGVSWRMFIFKANLERSLSLSLSLRIDSQPSTLFPCPVPEAAFPQLGGLQASCGPPGYSKGSRVKKKSHK